MAQGEFSPQSIGGLKLWLRADSGVTHSSGLVSQWVDSIGTVPFSGGTNLPMFASNDPQMNGRPRIRFSSDGINPQYLVKSPANFPAVCGASSFTVVSIARPQLSATSSARYRYLKFDGAGTSGYFLASFTNSLPANNYFSAFRFREPENFLQGKKSNSEAGAGVSPIFSAFTKSGSTSAINQNGLNSQANDVLELPVAFTEIACGSFDISVGIGYETWTLPGIIDIAEILIYDRALGTQEVDALGCYARSKYAITNYIGPCN